ncbi:MAG: hypothetical protein QM691_13030 [Opitutaceae bacterium]
MKRLRWAVIVLLLVAVGLFFWRWRGPNSGAETASPQPTATASPAHSAETVQSAVPAATSSAKEAGKPPSPQPVTKRERMANLLSAVNHKPIEFYGKVVDQFGVPVPAVDVYASVIYNSGLSAGVEKAQTKTDADGLFAIDGMKGRTLGIGLEKEGYEYGGDHGPFQFTEMVAESERHHPDPKNPVLFVMFKLQGAEPMLYFERKAFRLKPDGTPIRIDLATGRKVSSGGDIVVFLNQPLDESGKWLPHYAWTAQFEACGLREGTTKLMYLAPEDGYVGSLTYGEKGDERVQSHQAEKSFYLKTSDGRFARIRMDVHTQTSDEHQAAVGFTWWLNPKPGSRNLEFDPKTAITPKP